MIPNTDPHSPLHTPVHLSSAGYPATTPSSPIVGVFSQWGEQSEALRSSAVGSFVNKAKAMWRGKRHSYQWAGSADLREDKDTSRPATPRQATLPLLPLPSTFGGFARRPTRRRNGGSMQISSPTLISGPSFIRNLSLGGQDIWPLDTEADISREFTHIRSSRSNGYERRSSLPASIDGHSKCDRYSRSMSASTLAPPDTSYLTVGPPRAGSVPNLRESVSTEFAPSVNVSSEYDGVCCASPRMMDGLELEVSDTMMAISEAGLLQSSESEDRLEDTRRLREALANMFPMVEGSLLGTTRSYSGILHDMVDGCLDGEENTPLYHLPPREGDELGLRGLSMPESPGEQTLATCITRSLWVPQDTSQRPLQLASLQPEIQSLGGPQQVEIAPNEFCTLELDVAIESTMTLSRPTLKPLDIEGAVSRSMLHVPPRVPARSPSRPNLAQRAHISPVTCTLPDTYLPARPCILDSAQSDTSVISRQASGSSGHIARSRRTTRSLFVESQIAQVMRHAPVPGPSQTSNPLRKARSQSRLPKMRPKSRVLKKSTPGDVSQSTRTDHANEWILLTSSSSRNLHQRKPSRSSFGRSLYAQSSISSRRSRMSEVSSMRTGMVKSPSIRSGLTNLSGKPGLRASQSRSALHTRSRARLYSHGVNPRLSAVALQMNGLRASPSTRLLPNASKENLTTSTEPPNRPPRSPARPYSERRLEDTSEKENQPTPRIEGASPLEFTLQLTAPFEAAIDRRFACSNFTVSPPTPSLQRSRTAKARSSRKQELNEVHALVAGIGGNGALLRRTPTIAVPPRNPARVAMGARSGNWI
ncbi:hypothetical protein V565_063140 [Rhizoctonia solani 123E]|uniref:Uncharacterized protein n=1 Tax=Rhizoctonia solani 123E TaxID=1423351 RepID=A0A074RW76_9AGAM|nr:hypothetical protein V565_063140 [Rhizoctonia solani 123E]